MDKILEWRNSFLNARGLTNPTGESLYTYRITKDEFDRLRLTLKEFLSNSPIPGEIDEKNIYFPSLFVLYAAEWWRRHYNGEGFVWQPILESIGINNHWRDAQRSFCVEKGFQQWKLSLQNAKGLRFLGSIAFQGGLPMQLLASARGKIGQLLNRVLKLACDRTIDTTEIQSWVKSSSDSIPKSYQKEEVFLLLSEVIITVLHLREMAQLKNSVSAIEELDRKKPDWKNLFPLPVEDNEIKGIIEQLIRDATIKKPLNLKKEITVERWLEYDEDNI